MSKIIEAIAAEAMPYGTYVEVGADGYARPDPTFECRGGVVKRPVGRGSDAAAGDKVVVETHGPIQMLARGANVSVVLKSGRIKGGPGTVPGILRK